MRKRAIYLGLVGVAALLLLAWGANRIGLGKTSVAAAFDNPPDYPGYAWTRNGQAVPPEELGTSAGPQHCDLKSVTFLTIGWPLGTRSASADQARQYIRDPGGAIRSGNLKGTLTLRATLPTDARPTGYRYGSIQIIKSPSDEDRAIYVVGPDVAERWPRSNPVTLCQ